jgi:hypothetical protein
MWYERFNTYLIDIILYRRVVDSNIYVKRKLMHEKFVILALYVDNSIIIGNDMELLHATKECLAIGFEMTNESPIKDVGLVKLM